MKLETLVKRLGEKKNGAWFKIEWRSDLNSKLCAAAKRSGHVVIKEVSILPYRNNALNSVSFCFLSPQRALYRHWMRPFR